MPASRQGHVILGVNALVLGYLPAAWLWDPRLTARSPVDAGYWRHVGAVAERGTLDALFLADGPGLGDPSYDANAARLEPTVNWAALAAATERVGLIATASTTFNDPFELAERLLSLDYASGGRAGWNIVTTRHGQAAGNFGLAGLPERGDRYERAAEFTDLVLALWESAATGREVDHRAGPRSRSSLADERVAGVILRPAGAEQALREFLAIDLPGLTVSGLTAGGSAAPGSADPGRGTLRERLSLPAPEPLPATGRPAFPPPVPALT